METNLFISHFNNIADKSPIDISIYEFMESVRTGLVRGNQISTLINQIRLEENKEKRSGLKRSLPAVTISAICSGGHKKSNIVKPSGYIQVDIDNVTNVNSLKEILTKDPYVMLVFISPSGNGLKCVLKIGEEILSNIFESVRIYFKTTYSIEIDRQVKDESRLCYYSYDPSLFFNADAKLFSSNSIRIIDYSVKSEVERLITKLESSNIDITNCYNDWVMIGFALTDEFKEDGESYFHRISQFYPYYNYNNCSMQYQNCLRSGSKNISINTLITFVNKKLGLPNPPVNSQNQNGIDGHIVFYSPCYDKDGKLKDLKIDYTKWIEVLYNLGFRRFDMDKNFVFVRVVNQIIEEVSVTHIQDAFIHFLENLPENLNGGISREFLIGKFYRNPSHYFCENRLNLLRPKEPFTFNADTKEDCLIYFKNGFVRCNKDGYNLFPYTQLNGLIWKSQIVDRDFSCINTMLLQPKERGEFSHFTLNISGNDLNRYNSLTTIIGYLLHSHFLGKLKAVVFTDSKISDVPNGRTGKTLLGQALGYVKKFTEINGKDFDTTNKHKYQEVNLDTQIVHLNDVRKNFDFECLFNDITEGIVADKKNTKPFKVKAKMIISTNKTICIEGASAKDRAIEFEFADYYNEKFSPEDEFHHWFFRDWNETEWLNFYNFCLFCICSYLKNGIIVAASVNLNRRKLLESSNPEFVGFMDSQVKDGNIKPNMEYDKKELFDRFLAEAPEYAEMKSFKQRRFTDCLRGYAKYSGYFSPIDPDVHERKSGGVRYIIFPPI